MEAVDLANPRPTLNYVALRKYLTILGHFERPVGDLLLPSCESVGENNRGGRKSETSEPALLDCGEPGMSPYLRSLTSGPIAPFRAHLTGESVLRVDVCVCTSACKFCGTLTDRIKSILINTLESALEYFAIECNLAARRT